MIDGENFNDDVRNAVASLLKAANRVPFLFVGSGISRRYMGAEDWEGLLKWVCESVGKPMKPFYLYKQLAAGSEDTGKNILYPRMATLMEADFIGALDGPLADWAEAHRAEMETGTPAMKIYIAEHLVEFRPSMNLDEMDVLRGAARHVAGVITTNYDGLMESVFPKYDTFANQSDLLFSPLAGIGEIYKIHGSSDSPDSMIIDERDYRRLAERQSYLLSKILTIFGEYPIIFLGYSLKDQDIRDIISSIALCAGEQRAREMAERFIFVQYSADKSIKTTNYAVNDGQIVEMTAISTQDFTPIYEAIASTNMRYAPKLLNQITKQLFEASYTGGSAEKVIFEEIGNIDELPQDMDIVIGIGKKGYGIPVSSEELHADFLFHNKNLPASLIVNTYIDKYIPQGGSPMYYYLDNYDGPLSAKTRDEVNRKDSVNAYLSPTQRKRRDQWKEAGKLTIRSVAGLRQQFGEDAYKHLYLLNQSEIDTDELEDLLKAKAKQLIEEKQTLGSDMRKDIRILDFLKFGINYHKKKSAPPQSSPSAPSSEEKKPDESAGAPPSPDPDHARQPQVHL